MLFVPFVRPVKIKTIAFMCDGGGRAPKAVHLYVNHQSLDFSDVESTPATQSIEVPAPRAEEGDQGHNEEITVPLSFVKFQGVSLLTVSDWGVDMIRFDVGFQNDRSLTCQFVISH